MSVVLSAQHDKSCKNLSFQRRSYDVDTLCWPEFARVAAALGADRDGVLRTAGSLQARQPRRGHLPPEVVGEAEKRPRRLWDNTGGTAPSCSYHATIKMK